MIGRRDNLRIVRTGPAALIAAVCLTVACSQTAAPPTDPVVPSSAPGTAASSTVVLAVGQSTAVAASTTLTVDRVVGDSRCPIGTTCVWAGEVEIALTLSAPSGTQPFGLSDRADSATVQGLHFKLLSVAPHPRENTSIAVGDYRVSVQVTAK